MRRVDEQSHKDEMRAALRGDFERLRARRDDTEPSTTIGGAASDPVRRGKAPAPRPRLSDESWLERLFGR
jgi:hypothetical protein